MSSAMVAQQVLALPLDDGNDADATSIRDYLIKLLMAVWQDGEGFSGKRPFGNSSWEYDLYLPLLRAGLVGGQLDEHGYIEHVDEPAAGQLIRDAINELGRPA